MEEIGKTDVTIPEALTGEAEKTVGLEISLKVDIQSAGSAVEVPSPGR